MQKRPKKPLRPLSRARGRLQLGDEAAAIIQRLAEQHGPWQRAQLLAHLRDCLGTEKKRYRQRDLAELSGINLRAVNQGLHIADRLDASVWEEAGLDPSVAGIRLPHTALQAAARPQLVKARAEVLARAVKALEAGKPAGLAAQSAARRLSRQPEPFTLKVSAEGHVELVIRDEKAIGPEDALQIVQVLKPLVRRLRAQARATRRGS